MLNLFELVREDAYAYINLTGAPYCTAASSCEYLCHRSDKLRGGQSANRVFIKFYADLSFNRAYLAASLAGDHRILYWQIAATQWRRISQSFTLYFGWRVLHGDILRLNTFGFGWRAAHYFSCWRVYGQLKERRCYSTSTITPIRVKPVRNWNRKWLIRFVYCPFHT